jgi:hypothetical protein
MRTIVLAILLPVMLAGCGNPSSPKAEAPAKDQTPVGTISYTGGDGLSVEHAVVINGATGEGDGVKAEYTWLRQHYQAYRLLRQGLRNENGRAYDEMDIATPEGNRSVFFDITSFYGK